MAKTEAMRPQQQQKSQGGESMSSRQEEFNPTTDLVEYCKQYAKEKPEMMALWCFGIGFVLGWKLKPW